MLRGSVVTFGGRLESLQRSRYHEHCETNTGWDLGGDAHAGVPWVGHPFDEELTVSPCFRRSSAIECDRNNVKGEIWMGLRHLGCCVLAAAWAVTVAASPRPPAASDHQILIGRAQGWNEACYRKRDPYIENLMGAGVLAE